MSSEFDRQVAAFEARHIKRHVQKFWTLFDKIELDQEDAEEWCVTPQYCLNLRTIFEAIDDEDWKDIEEAIERLNLYA